MQRIRALKVYGATSWIIFIVPLIVSIQQFSALHLHLKISIPVDLLLSYMAAATFFACSMAFDATCPEIILRHKDFRAYLQHTLDTVNAVAVLERARGDAIEQIMTGLHEVNKDSEKQLSSTPADVEALLNSLIKEQISKSFVDDAEPSWNSENGRHALMRLLVSIGFTCAALIATYVAFIDTPRSVFRALDLMYF